MKRSDDGENWPLIYFLLGMDAVMLALIAAMLLSGCATAHTAVPDVVPVVHVVDPTPTVVPDVVPPVVARHTLAQLGLWHEDGQTFAAVTTFRVIDIGCKDDAAYASALQLLAQDARALVWTMNTFSYGPTARSTHGYTLRADADECWAELRTLVAQFRDRTLAVWGPDEIESVAFGDTAPYDANVYNDIVTTACQLVHRDLLGVRYGLNYGSVPDALIVPACLDIVGLEAYRADWRTQHQRLSAKSGARRWLLAPGFTDPTFSTDDDAAIAARLSEEAEYAETHEDVDALFVFTGCCDDTVTTAAFYTLSGGRLALARAAFDNIGHRTTGR